MTSPAFQWRRAMLAAASSAVMAVHSASAQERESPPPQTTAPATVSPGDVIRQMEQAFRVRDALVNTLLQRIEALERELAALRAGTTPAPAVAAAGPGPSAPTTSKEQYEEEERLARAALDRALLARGGLLLPQWTAEVEQGASYFNASSDLISIDGFSIFPVLIIGDIVSERIRRDIVHAPISARLGIPGGFQADLRLPFGYEKERTVTADQRERTRSAMGLGDAEIGLSRQVLRERGKRPDLLASVHWKSATGRDPFNLNSTAPALGTGFHSVQGSLTAAKTSDPVVFFGGLSYTANLAASKEFRGLDPAAPDEPTIGRFDPGNTIGMQMGLAMGLNADTSLSLGWNQRFSARTTFNRAPLPGTFLTEANFRIGTSYVYAPSRAVDVGLGIGLTRDAPDFQFNLAFPFRFSLLKKTP